jgi:hypothetical protein
MAIPRNCDICDNRIDHECTSDGYFALFRYTALPTNTAPCNFFRNRLSKRDRQVLAVIKSHVGYVTRNFIADKVFFTPCNELRHLLQYGYITARKEMNPRWGFTGYRNLYSVVPKEASSDGL